MPQYAFSLNGENWSGAFETREGALTGALQKCSGASDPPGTVFVAEIMGGEVFGDHLGQAVIAEMRSRARGVEDRYLKEVTARQMNSLDNQIERTLVGWLQENHLMPQTFKVEAISEHLIPMPHRGLERSNQVHEVQDLGVENESA